MLVVLEPSLSKPFTKYSRNLHELPISLKLLKNALHLRNFGPVFKPVLRLTQYLQSLWATSSSFRHFFFFFLVRKLNMLGIQTKVIYQQMTPGQCDLISQPLNIWEEEWSFLPFRNRPTRKTIVKIPTNLSLPFPLHRREKWTIWHLIKVLWSKRRDIFSFDMEANSQHLIFQALTVCKYHQHHNKLSYNPSKPLGSSYKCSWNHVAARSLGQEKASSKPSSLDANLVCERVTQFPSSACIWCFKHFRPGICSYCVWDGTHPRQWDPDLSLGF